MTDPRKTLQILFRESSKLVLFETRAHIRRPRDWGHVKYEYAIVSGSRNGLCNRTKFVWAEGKARTGQLMSHETPSSQYLKIPDLGIHIPQDKNAGQVRPRGIGIYSRVFQKCFPSISIADQVGAAVFGCNCN